MNRIKIKLTKGSSLYKPGTTSLIKEGEVLDVNDSTFWRRRLADGSVEIVPAVHKEPVFKTADKPKNNLSKENE